MPWSSSVRFMEHWRKVEPTVGASGVKSSNTVRRCRGGAGRGEDPGGCEGAAAEARGRQPGREALAEASPG